MKVNVKDIKMGPRKSTCSQQTYSNLKSSIAANGIVHPITIDRHFNLVDGFVRVDVANDLGIEKIEAHIVGALVLSNCVGTETVTILDYKEEDDGWYGHDLGANGMVDRQVGFHSRERWHVN